MPITDADRELTTKIMQAFAAYGATFAPDHIARILAEAREHREQDERERVIAAAWLDANVPNWRSGRLQRCR